MTGADTNLDVFLHPGNNQLDLRILAGGLPKQSIRGCGPLLLSPFIDIIFLTLAPSPISSVLPYFGESGTLGASPVRACHQAPSEEVRSLRTLVVLRV
jgi:hypothetical protein